MTTYILHGGFCTTQNELNDGFWAEFTKDIKDGDNILLILFARDKYEREDVFQKNKEYLVKQSGGGLLTP